jgi:molybdenum cofactor biosynthesis enzyme MoaA
MKAIYTNDSLDKIGFYTLTDNRAQNTSIDSPLWRCELILTSACNFRCPYCKGGNTDYHLHFKDARDIVSKWIDGGLKNIRFSGGEPTLWNGLSKLVKYAKLNNIERIAVSTNGFNTLKYYRRLIDCGVSDFSISLDACCASTGDIMAGKISGAWDRVVGNIEKLSKLVYVTVGVVLTNDNIQDLENIIDFSYNLGVSDIRIISAAQWNNQSKFKNIYIDKNILNEYPILKYRINNFNNGRNVRGIKKTDCHKCYLMLDDMVVENNKHYPCIIYMREGGKEIGNIKDKNINEIRKERFNYIEYHSTLEDEICKNNCLDICIDYNNKVGLK